MNPLISPEQRKALDEQYGAPIVVIDPDRQQRFVLIADTDYRVRDLAEDSNAAARGLRKRKLAGEISSTKTSLERSLPGSGRNLPFSIGRETPITTKSPLIQSKVIIVVQAQIEVAP